MKTAIAIATLLLTGCASKEATPLEQLFYFLNMPAKPEQAGTVVGSISHFTLASLHANSVSVSYTIKW